MKVAGDDVRPAEELDKAIEAAMPRTSDDLTDHFAVDEGQALVATARSKSSTTTRPPLGGGNRATVGYGYQLGFVRICPPGYMPR
jgi:hypothetical protein